MYTCTVECSALQAPFSQDNDELTMSCLLKTIPYYFDLVIDQEWSDTTGRDKLENTVTKREVYIGLVMYNITEYSRTAKQAVHWIRSTSFRLFIRNPGLRVDHASLGETHFNTVLMHGHDAE